MKKLNDTLRSLDQWLFLKVEKIVLGKLEKDEKGKIHKYNLLESYYEWQLALYISLIFLVYPFLLSLYEVSSTKQLLFNLLFHFVLWLPLALFINYNRHRRLKKDKDFHDKIWPLRQFAEVREMNAYHCKYLFDAMQPMRIAFMKVQGVVMLTIFPLFLAMPFATSKLMVFFLLSEYVYDEFSKYVDCVNDMGEGGKKEKAKVKARMTNLQLSRWKQLTQGIGCG